FNELLLSTLKVFPYFTIVIDTSGAEADGYFSTMYFCNQSPGANSKTAVRESRVVQRKRAGPITQRSMDRNHPLLGKPRELKMQRTAFVNIEIISMLTKADQKSTR